MLALNLWYSPYLGIPATGIKDLNNHTKQDLFSLQTDYIAIPKTKEMMYPKSTTLGLTLALDFIFVLQ